MRKRRKETSKGCLPRQLEKIDFFEKKSNKNSSSRNKLAFDDLKREKIFFFLKS